MGCVDFAWYVIWTNKNKLGKNHNTTWHSWIGVAALLLTNGQCIASSFSMWPGKSKASREENKDLHILGGKCTFIIAMIATSFGWYKLRSSFIISIVWFNAALIIFVIALLTRLLTTIYKPLARVLTKHHKLL